MDTELKKTLLALLFTVIIGGIIKAYFDYKTKLMETVWEKRLLAYMEFVKRTALFPKYPRGHVHWKEVFGLSEKFRDWYFEGYGLVLSSHIRAVYFDLQEYLVELTMDRRDSEQLLHEDEYDELRERCSALRSLMARELESRESPVWYRFKKETKA